MRIIFSYKNILQSRLTPIAPLYAGVRGITSTKWSGTAAELSYNPYLRNGWVVVDTGVKGGVGSPLIEFSTWEEEVSDYNIVIPNSFSYRFFLRRDACVPRFLVRNSAEASEWWFIVSGVRTTLNLWNRRSLNKFAVRARNSGRFRSVVYTNFKYFNILSGFQNIVRGSIPFGLNKTADLVSWGRKRRDLSVNFFYVSKSISHRLLHISAYMHNRAYFSINYGAKRTESNLFFTEFLFFKPFGFKRTLNSTQSSCNSLLQEINAQVPTNFSRIIYGLNTLVVLFLERYRLFSSVSFFFVLFKKLSFELIVLFIFSMRNGRTVRWVDVITFANSVIRRVFSFLMATYLSGYNFITFLVSSFFELTRKVNLGLGFSLRSNANHITAYVGLFAYKIKQMSIASILNKQSYNTLSSVFVEYNVATRDILASYAKHRGRRIRRRRLRRLFKAKRWRMRYFKRRVKTWSRWALNNSLPGESKEFVFRYRWKRLQRVLKLSSSTGQYTFLFFWAFQFFNFQQLNLKKRKFFFLAMRVAYFFKAFLKFFKFYAFYFKLLRRWDLTGLETYSETGDFFLNVKTYCIFLFSKFRRLLLNFRLFCLKIAIVRWGQTSSILFRETRTLRRTFIRGGRRYFMKFKAFKNVQARRLVQKLPVYSKFLTWTSSSSSVGFRGIKFMAGRARSYLRYLARLRLNYYSFKVGRLLSFSEPYDELPTALSFISSARCAHNYKLIYRLLRSRGVKKHYMRYTLFLKLVYFKFGLSYYFAFFRKYLSYLKSRWRLFKVLVRKLKWLHWKYTGFCNRFRRFLTVKGYKKYFFFVTKKRVRRPIRAIIDRKWFLRKILVVNSRKPSRRLWNKIFLKFVIRSRKLLSLLISKRVLLSWKRDVHAQLGKNFIEPKLNLQLPSIIKLLWMDLPTIGKLKFSHKYFSERCKKRKEFVDLPKVVETFEAACFGLYRVLQLACVGVQDRALAVQIYRGLARKTALVCRAYTLSYDRHYFLSLFSFIQQQLTGLAFNKFFPKLVDSFIAMGPGSSFGFERLWTLPDLSDLWVLAATPVVFYKKLIDNCHCTIFLQLFKLSFYLRKQFVRIAIFLSVQLEFIRKRSFVNVFDICSIALFAHTREVLNKRSVGLPPYFLENAAAVAIVRPVVRFLRFSTLFLVDFVRMQKILHRPYSRSIFSLLSNAGAVGLDKVFFDSTYLKNGMLPINLVVFTGFWNRSALLGSATFKDRLVKEVFSISPKNWRFYKFSGWRCKIMKRFFKRSFLNKNSVVKYFKAVAQIFVVVGGSRRCGRIFNSINPNFFNLKISRLFHHIRGLHPLRLLGNARRIGIWPKNLKLYQKKPRPKPDYEINPAKNRQSLVPDKTFKMPPSIFSRDNYESMNLVWDFAHEDYKFSRLNVEARARRWKYNRKQLARRVLFLMRKKFKLKYFRRTFRYRRFLRKRWFRRKLKKKAWRALIRVFSKLKALSGLRVVYRGGWSWRRLRNRKVPYSAVIVFSLVLNRFLFAIYSRFMAIKCDLRCNLFKTLKLQFVFLMVRGFFKKMGRFFGNFTWTYRAVFGNLSMCENLFAEKLSALALVVTRLYCPGITYRWTEPMYIFNVKLMENYVELEFFGVRILPDFFVATKNGPEWYPFYDLIVSLPWRTMETGLFAPYPTFLKADIFYSTALKLLFNADEWLVCCENLNIFQHSIRGLFNSTVFNMWVPTRRRKKHLVVVRRLMTYLKPLRSATRIRLIKKRLITQVYIKRLRVIKQRLPRRIRFSRLKRINLREKLLKPNVQWFHFRPTHITIFKYSLRRRVYRALRRTARAVNRVYWKTRSHFLTIKAGDSPFAIQIKRDRLHRSRLSWRANGVSLWKLKRFAGRRRCKVKSFPRFLIRCVVPNTWRKISRKRLNPVFKRRWRLAFKKSRRFRRRNRF